MKIVCKIVVLNEAAIVFDSLCETLLLFFFKLTE